jgi:hypothetical protein
MAKQYDNLEDANKEIAKLTKQIKDSQKKFDDPEKQAEYDRARIQAKRQIIEMLHEERDALADLGALHDSNMDQELAGHKAAMEHAIEELDVNDEKYHQKRRDLELDYTRIKASHDLTKANRNQFNTILTSLTGISDVWKKSTWGMLLEPEGWKALSMGVAETLNPMNILGSSLLKVQETTLGLALAQDNAIAEMHKLTGAAPGLEKQMIALEHEFSGYGVSADEAGKSLSTLFNTVTDFNRMGPATQKEVAETTAVLNELGVSMDTTAQNMQGLTKVFGMSGVQAAETSRELFTFAQNIGMAPEEVANNFGKAMPKMAAFGEQGVDTFKKLQAAAKQSGMSVDQMLSIVEKFDTFDGAAESVGKLNAILGGPFLSSLDMVTTTDPTERMRMLSEAVNQSGQSFDEMSYYQRKALADAMGLSDVSELALLMRDGFDAAVPAQQKSQEELAAQAEQAKEFQTVAEEMTQTARQFAVSMRPVVKAFKNLLQFVQDVNTAFGGYLIPTLVLLAGTYVTIIKLSKIWGVVTGVLNLGIFKTIGLKIKEAFATGQQSVAQEQLNRRRRRGTRNLRRQQRALAGSGKAAALSAPQMMAFGVAVMFVGAGVFLAALGVAAIALAFSKLDIAQMIGATVAIVAFGYGVIAVIGALSTLVAGPQAALVAGAAGVLLAVGAAALMAGGGIALIAFGMSLLVDSFARLLDTATPEKMLGFTIALAGFVATLFLMVPLLNFLPLIAVGLIAVGFAMWLLSEYVNTLDLTGIEVLGTFFGGIAGLISATQENIDGVAQGIAKIVAEVDKLDTNKAITLSAAMDSVSAATVAVAGATSNETSGPRNVVNDGKPIEVVLKLKDKVLSRKIIKGVNGVLDPTNPIPTF